jgi:hypothetical protein
LKFLPHCLAPKNIEFIFQNSRCHTVFRERKENRRNISREDVPLVALETVSLDLVCRVDSVDAVLTAANE